MPLSSSGQVPPYPALHQGSQGVGACEMSSELCAGGDRSSCNPEPTLLPKHSWFMHSPVGKKERPLLAVLFKISGDI